LTLDGEAQEGFTNIPDLIKVMASMMILPRHIRYM